VLPKFTWNIDPIFLHLGPLALRYYSLLFVGVFLGGYALLKWQIERGGGDEDDAGDFIVYGVFGVLIGARLGHVIFYDWKKALADPVWIFEIWKGGLASHGATAGLIFAMWLFTRRRGVPFLEGADRFAFSAALGATLVRVGNFFNSEIVGRPTDQTWGVRFPRYDGNFHGPFRYPTQFYEAGLGLLVMLVLYLVDRWAGKERRPRGLLISVFFAVYFTGRFFVEYFKAYQTLPTSYPLTMGQLLSIPAALLGYVGIAWSLKAKLPVGWAPPEDLEEEEELLDEDEDDEDDEDEEEEPPPPPTKKKKAKKRPAPAADDDDADDDDADDDDADDDDADDDDADDDE